MRPKRFHRRNRLLNGSKRSSRQMMKWVGRVCPDLLWNTCMQRQMFVRNDCAQNGWMDRSARFHHRNRLLYGSKRSSHQMMKWVGRVWSDLLWNTCMQRQTSVWNDCAQNGWMDRSARFHRQNLIINGSMEAPWLDLYWVGMNLQSGHMSTADL
jgi:hypothetical protein